MMEYGYKKRIDMPFAEAVSRVTEELGKQGFGVLTQIDVKATLKKKIGVDLEDYVILGACNPPNAYKALQAEQDIGLMLPCNVVVYVRGGKTFVSAVLPTVSMGMIRNDSLKAVAIQVESKLKRVVDDV
ncbi:MAG: DUF302 domain-containing protein [Nanoarchaeota archaeon]